MAANLPPIENQDAYLYEGEWCKEIDFLFVEVITFQARMDNFKFGTKNYSAIGIAIDAINRRFGKRFSYKYCEVKVNHLFKCYTTFAWMLSLTEVMYDEVTKHVHSPNRTWEFILQSNPFAMAYRHSGDPSWYEVEEIFGPKEALEKEPRADVIVVSSESEDEVHEPAASANIRCVLVPRVVERPPTTTSRSIQMSIWDFVGYASDSYTTMDTKESTSNMKSKKSKAKKVSAPSLMMEDPKPGESGSASSCCSNDPYGKRHVP